MHRELMIWAIFLQGFRKSNEAYQAYEAYEAYETYETYEA